MKKKVIPSIILFFSLAFLCYCHISSQSSSLTPAPSATSLAPDIISPTETAPPSLHLSATGACLMDASSGRILYGKEEVTPRPMASTTKIMTCILALECGNRSDTVTFSERACRMPRVHLGVSKGATFPLDDLLYSLMLESHNDTAVAIAEHIGGSVEGFAAMMNAKAKELGMPLTNFVTPNGLDADGHGSSPADMCRLAAYACKNQDFLHIIGTASKNIRTTDGKQCYSLTNRDIFLSTYAGAIGVKTGFTNKAGYCFVGAAKRENVVLTSCVLASGWPPNKSYKWTDTKALMDYGFKHYSYRTLPVKDLSTYVIPVREGKASSITVVQPEIPPYLLSSFDEIHITYELPTNLIAPVKTDVAIGTLTITLNGSKHAVYPLYPTASIEPITFADIWHQTLDLFLDF